MCNWVLPFLTSADLLRTNAREGVPDFDDWRDRLVDAIDDVHETAKTLPLTRLPGQPRVDALLRGVAGPPHPRRLLAGAQHRGPPRPGPRPGAQHRRLVRHLPRRLAAQLHRRAGAGRDRRRRARAAASSSVPGRTPRRRWRNPARSISAPGRAEPDAAEHGRRRRAPALLRPLAEGDRRRLRRRAAGAALRHGRERLARRERVAAGARRGDRVLPAAAAATPTRSPATARSRQEAPGDERPDVFLYDPFHPVPTVGGSSAATRRRSPPAPTTSARSKRGPTCWSTPRRRWSRTPK